MSVRASCSSIKMEVFRLFDWDVSVRWREVRLPDPIRIPNRRGSLWEGEQRMFPLCSRRMVRGREPNAGRTEEKKSTHDFIVYKRQARQIIIIIIIIKTRVDHSGHECSRYSHHHVQNGGDTSMSPINLFPLSASLALFYYGVQGEELEYRKKKASGGRMQSPGITNPALAPLSQSELIILNEKAYSLSFESFYYCAPRCITHYNEDSIPYNSGEKACLDRCMKQLANAQAMSQDIKRKFQEELQAQRLPYSWMQRAANHERTSCGVSGWHRSHVVIKLKKQKEARPFSCFFFFRFPTFYFYFVVVVYKFDFCLLSFLLLREGYTFAKFIRTHRFIIAGSCRVLLSLLLLLLDPLDLSPPQTQTHTHIYWVSYCYTVDCFCIEDILFCVGGSLLFYREIHRSPLEHHHHHPLRHSLHPVPLIIYHNSIKNHISCLSFIYIYIYIYIVVVVVCPASQAISRSACLAAHLFARFGFIYIIIILFFIYIFVNFSSSTGHHSLMWQKYARRGRARGGQRQGRGGRSPNPNPEAVADSSPQMPCSGGSRIAPAPAPPPGPPFEKHRPAASGDPGVCVVPLSVCALAQHTGTALPTHSSGVVGLGATPNAWRGYEYNHQHLRGAYEEDHHHHEEGGIGHHAAPQDGGGSRARATRLRSPEYPEAGSPATLAAPPDAFADPISYHQEPLLGRAFHHDPALLRPSPSFSAGGRDPTALGRRPEPTNLFRLVQSMNGGGYGQLKSLTGRSFFLEFGPQLAREQQSKRSERGVAAVAGLRATQAHAGGGPLGIVVSFLHVQSDPFAPGSQVEVEVPVPFDMADILEGFPLHRMVETVMQEEGRGLPSGAAAAALPSLQHTLWERMVDIRRVAAEDYLLRAWKRQLFEGVEDEEEEKEDDHSGGTPLVRRYHKRGTIEVIKTSPHILSRSAVQLDVRLEGQLLCQLEKLSSSSPPPHHERGAGGGGTAQTAAAPRCFVRFYARMKLPGHGRRIDSPGILRLLQDELLRSTAQLWSELNDPSPPPCTHSTPQHAPGARSTAAIESMRRYVDHITDQEWLRSRLQPSGLAAFVADGAVLPRAAGNSDRPLRVAPAFHSVLLSDAQQQQQQAWEEEEEEEEGGERAAQQGCGSKTPTAGAIPFESPPSLSRSFPLPCSGRVVSGMGLPRGGLTLIAGGGFHGKSTLLRALELGIYNHTPGDGREFVVTDPTAVKIRAEDRRAVHGVDISPFITNLPFQKDTKFFVTAEASGSTSQAANLMEALELGAGTLLLDEDTSATNLMYRDALVQALVPATEEPITSLVDRVPALIRHRGVSMILVVGGSGQYFPHADVVLVLKQYRARDATAEAKVIVQQHGLCVDGGQEQGQQQPFGFFDRHVDPRSTFTSLAAGGDGVAGGGRGGGYYGGGRRGGRGGSPSYSSSPDGGSQSGGGRARLKVSASSASRIRLGLEEEVDLSLVEQLVEEGQLQAIAQCLALCYDKGEGWVDRVQAGAGPRDDDVFSDGLIPVSASHGARALVVRTVERPAPALVPPPYTALLHSSPPPQLQQHLLSSFPLGAASHYARLLYTCERSLRQAQLELNTPSAYLPRGFTSLPRVMEIGAALNRLRSLRTMYVRQRSYHPIMVSSPLEKKTKSHPSLVRGCSVNTSVLLRLGQCLVLLYASKANILYLFEPNTPSFLCIHYEYTIECFLVFVVVVLFFLMKGKVLIVLWSHDTLLFPLRTTPFSFQYCFNALPHTNRQTVESYTSNLKAKPLPGFVKYIYPCFFRKAEFFTPAKPCEAAAAQDVVVVADGERKQSPSAAEMAAEVDGTGYPKEDSRCHDDDAERDETVVALQPVAGESVVVAEEELTKFGYRQYQDKAGLFRIATVVYTVSIFILPLTYYLPHGWIAVTVLVLCQFSRQLVANWCFALCTMFTARSAPEHSNADGKICILEGGSAAALQRLLTAVKRFFRLEEGRRVSVTGLVMWGVWIPPLGHGILLPLISYIPFKLMVRVLKRMFGWLGGWCLIEEDATNPTAPGGGGNLVVVVFFSFFTYCLCVTAWWCEAVVEGGVAALVHSRLLFLIVAPHSFTFCRDTCVIECVSRRSFLILTLTKTISRKMACQQQTPPFIFDLLLNFNRSTVAQWERDGLITHRSLDRNQSVLIFLHVFLGGPHDKTTVHHQMIPLYFYLFTLTHLYMNDLLEDLGWPVSSGSEVEEQQWLRNTGEPLSYPQYVALLLLSGLRLGIPCDVVHRVFQISGRWELQGGDGDPLAVRLVEEAEDEPEDLTASLSSRSSSSSSAGCKGATPSQRGAPSFSGPPQSFYCAHLTREGAAAFVESPSTVPAFHYFFEVPTNERLVQLVSSDPTLAPRLPLDCLFCLQEQLGPALLGRDKAGRRRTQSRQARVVVHTLLHDEGAAAASPLRHHYEVHLQRQKGLLAQLEEGDDACACASGQHASREEREKGGHGLNAELKVQYVGESGGDEEEEEEEEEFDVTTEVGREACEAAAVEAGRHSAFLAVSGTMTCPVAVCYCAACRLVGPLTRFEPRLEGGGPSSPVPSSCPPSSLYDPSRWVSVDRSTLIVSRLLLALHVLQEAIPDALVGGAKQLEEEEEKEMVGVEPTVQEKRLVVDPIAEQKKPDNATATECKAIDPQPQAFADAAALAKVEQGVGGSASSIDLCPGGPTVGQKQKLPAHVPPLRCRYLFLPTPLPFEDCMRRQQQSMTDTPSQTDDDEEGGDLVEGEAPRSLEREGGRHWARRTATAADRQRVTQRFESAMEEVTTVEAILPGSRWVQREPGRSPSSCFRFQLCYPSDLKDPELEMVKVLHHGGEEEEKEVGEGETLGYGVCFSDSLLQLRDAVGGFLVLFVSPEALRACITDGLIPQLLREAGQNPAEGYFPLPHRLSYRSVYHAEEEKWVEACVLHHDWYHYRPPSPIESEEEENNSTAPRSPQAGGPPSHSPPPAVAEQDTDELLRYAAQSMRGFTSKNSSYPYRLDGGRAHQRPEAHNGVAHSRTTSASTSINSSGFAFASQWLGETADGFRRAFASYTLLFPPQVTSVAAFLPPDLAPPHEPDEAHTAVDQRNCSLVEKPARSTSSTHSDDPPNEPQDEEEARARSAQPSIARRRRAPLHYPINNTMFVSTIPSAYTPAERHTPRPPLRPPSQEDIPGRSTVPAPYHNQQVGRAGGAEEDAVADLPHPLSVEARRLEFLLGVTALAKMMGDLLPQEPPHPEKGRSHSQSYTRSRMWVGGGYTPTEMQQRDLAVRHICVLVDSFYALLTCYIRQIHIYSYREPHQRHHHVRNQNREEERERGGPVAHRTPPLPFLLKREEVVCGQGAGKAPSLVYAASTLPDRLFSLCYRMLSLLRAAGRADAAAATGKGSPSESISPSPLCEAATSPADLEADLQALFHAEQRAAIHRNAALGGGAAGTCPPPPSATRADATTVLRWMYRYRRSAAATSGGVAPTSRSATAVQHSLDFGLLCSRLMELVVGRQSEAGQEEEDSESIAGPSAAALAASWADLFCASPSPAHSTREVWEESLEERASLHLLAQDHDLYRHAHHLSWLLQQHHDSSMSCLAAVVPQLWRAADPAAAARLLVMTSSAPPRPLSPTAVPSLFQPFRLPSPAASCRNRKRERESRCDHLHVSPKKKAAEQTLLPSCKPADAPSPATAAPRLPSGSAKNSFRIKFGGYRAPSPPPPPAPTPPPPPPPQQQQQLPLSSPTSGNDRVSARSSLWESLGLSCSAAPGSLPPPAPLPNPAPGVREARSAAPQPAASPASILSAFTLGAQAPAPAPPNSQRPPASAAPPLQPVANPFATGPHQQQQQPQSGARGPVPGAASGFVTAGEQLEEDIAAGRTNAVHAKFRTNQLRSPALGLRRSGFQAPFQSNSNSPAAGADGAAAPPPGSLLYQQQQGRQAAETKNRNNNSKPGDGSGDGESRFKVEDYPKCVLLPDGTVPPSLQSLDPKLVSQVTMEIVEYRALAAAEQQEQGGDGAAPVKPRAAVSWDDIAGLSDAKRSVEEAIVWPLRRPDLFVGLRDPPRGLLLFGPPGTGKTLIARAIASRAQCTFFNISAASLMSKWYGEAEQLVRCLFAVATVKQPSVIFVDEVDSLLSMRGDGENDAERRLKTEFLVQMDGVGTRSTDRVLLIGATNRPDELDEAARRRLEKRLYIPLPNPAARRELIQRLLHSLQVDYNERHRKEGGEGAAAPPKVHALSEKDFTRLVEATEGYSGADLRLLCREAAMAPLREASKTLDLHRLALSDLRPLHRKDFKAALRRMKPSVGPSEVERYERWNKQFGSFGDEAAGEAHSDRKKQLRKARAAHGKEGGGASSLPGSSSDADSNEDGEASGSFDDSQRKGGRVIPHSGLCPPRFKLTDIEILKVFIRASEEAKIQENKGTLEDNGAGPHCHAFADIQLKYYSSGLLLFICYYLFIYLFIYYYYYYYYYYYSSSVFCSFSSVYIHSDTSYAIHTPLLSSNLLEIIYLFIYLLSKSRRFSRAHLTRPRHKKIKQRTRTNKPLYLAIYLIISLFLLLDVLQRPSGPSSSAVSHLHPQGHNNSSARPSTSPSSSSSTRPSTNGNTVVASPNLHTFPPPSSPLPNPLTSPVSPATGQRLPRGGTRSSADHLPTQISNVGDVGSPREGSTTRRRHRQRNSGTSPRTTSPPIIVSSGAGARPQQLSSTLGSAHAASLSQQQQQQQRRQSEPGAGVTNTSLPYLPSGRSGHPSSLLLDQPAHDEDQDTVETMDSTAAALMQQNAAGPPDQLLRLGSLVSSPIPLPHKNQTNNSHHHHSTSLSGNKVDGNNNSTFTSSSSSGGGGGAVNHLHHTNPDSTDNGSSLSNTQRSLAVIPFHPIPGAHPSPPTPSRSAGTNRPSVGGDYPHFSSERERREPSSSPPRRSPSVPVLPGALVQVCPTCHRPIDAPFANVFDAAPHNRFPPQYFRQLPGPPTLLAIEDHAAPSASNGAVVPSAGVAPGTTTPGFVYPALVPSNMNSSSTGSSSHRFLGALTALVNTSPTASNLPAPDTSPPRDRFLRSTTSHGSSAANTPRARHARRSRRSSLNPEGSGRRSRRQSLGLDHLAGVYSYVSPTTASETHSGPSAGAGLAPDDLDQYVDPDLLELLARHQAHLRGEKTEKEIEEEAEKAAFHDAWAEEERVPPEVSMPLPTNTAPTSYYEKYFLESKKLGSGTFGGVYLCMHVMEGVPLGTFALKKIPVGDNIQYLQTVLREVRILEEVKRHPNVVEYNHSWVDTAKTADFGPPVRCLFILMEYANEGSLDSYLERHSTVLSTMAVCDFGTAALLGERPANRTGGTGTLEYMAPELFERDPTALPEQERYLYSHTKASDVWSLGMILHFLACGTALPRRGPKGNVLLDVPALSPVPRPPEMLELIRAMLQFDPAKRPTCKDIMRSTVAQTLLASFNNTPFTATDLFSVMYSSSGGMAAADGIRAGCSSEEEEEEELASSRVELLSTLVTATPLLQQYQTNERVAAGNLLGSPSKIPAAALGATQRGSTNHSQGQVATALPAPPIPGPPVKRPRPITPAGALPA
eukprot:gene9316-6555_t